ncbi:VanZ family protein [Streptomyces sp. NBC_01476]|uniref:VanZ family protein n=1 Tax=Streptomyces sp. NBC_01476 TaxID=2903881 RepID=UPI003FCE9CB3
MTPKRDEPKPRAPRKDAAATTETRAPRRIPRMRASKTTEPKTREPKAGALKAREPKTREPKTREPKTGGTKKRAPKTRGAAVRTPKSRTPAASAAAEPRRPVLQRRSLGSTLARAAVMAIAIVGMVAFAVALAKVTLVPSPASVNLIHTNLKPGASIRAYLDQPETRDTIKQIGGNVLLGVPFGVLLPMLFPRARGLFRVLLITAFVMVLVEATQGAIVEGRAFDIDDVILNTAGALIGYLLLGRRLGRALHPRRTHWWHRLGFGTPPEQ